MDVFFLNVIKIVLQALLFLCVAIAIIWFYFRIRPTPSSPPPVHQSTGGNGEKVITTLKLQACERLILFLERISPSNLILRIHSPEMTVSQLQAALIRSVREEFEYNLSQQLYLSSKTWELIRSAKEEAIRQINAAASGLSEENTARNLAKAVLQRSLNAEKSPISMAIEAIKQEIG